MCLVLLVRKKLFDWEKKIFLPQHISVANYMQQEIESKNFLP